MKLLLGVFLAFVIAAPAHADWQGIDWGMTQAEIEAADSDVQVYRLEEEKRKRMRPVTSTLGGKWTRDGQDYQLYFYFDTEGELQFIDVEPDGVDCAGMNDLLADQFGDFEEEIDKLGPATRTVRHWSLKRTVELHSLVLHFPGDTSWSCNAVIRNPAPWLSR